MFRVYVEGKSVNQLKTNLMMFAKSINADVDVVPVDAHNAGVEEMYDTDNESQAGEIHASPTSAQATEGIVNATSSTPPNPTEVDSRGVAWDHRIHASSKALNKDGSWRTRRGVEESEVARLEKKTTLSPSPAPAAPPIPNARPSVDPVPSPVAAAPIPPVPAAASVAQPTSVAQLAIVPPPPSYDNVQAPPQVATKPAHSLETFKANFIPCIGQLVKEGKVDQPGLQQWCDYFQVKQIWDIAKNDAQLAQFFNSFCDAGLITKVG